MRIELLYFDGCPSHEAFLPRLQELLARAEMDVAVEQRRVESDEAAQREQFLGSPTLLVDGVDIDPGADGRTDYGLKCRLYSAHDGLRGTPPDEWVLDALRRATTTRVFALVLTGAPGAGKTAVLEALSDQLVVEDVRHALVETEALTSAHPSLDDEQWLEPIQAVCGLYRRLDYPLLLVAVTVESGEDLRRLLAAVGAEEHAVVRLEAEPETLHRRIVEREPAGWSGLDELLAASARLSRVIERLDGVALALNTEGQRAPMVAERIRDAFPHMLRPAAGWAARGR